MRSARFLVLIASLLPACGRGSPDRPLAPAAVPTRMAHRDRAAPAGAPASGAGACRLRLDDLAEDEPARIPLRSWPTTSLPDDCPVGFNPAALLAPQGCAAPECRSGTVAGGRRAALRVDGPAGSGRFTALGLAVDGPAQPRFACATASTVAWRHLYRVSQMLAPLPWLADLDGDSAAELVVWQRLPWGDAESDNGLVPIVYAVEGDALVRRDRTARALARRVAAAYRALVRTARPEDPVECYRAMARTLDSWGRG